MKLSFKETKFIVEALDLLIKTYNERLEEIEESKTQEDDAADLGNDVMFLEMLLKEIEQNLAKGNILELPEFSREENTMSWTEQGNPFRKLSIDDRLSMIEAITASIRQENNRQENKLLFRLNSDSDVTRNPTFKINP